MKTNDMDSNNLASALVKQDFCHTGAFAFSKGLGVGTETSLALSELPSLLFGHFSCLFFRGSNHGNFWVCETSSRNGIMVDNVSSSNNVLNSRNSLCGSSMGKHHFSISITDAVHSRNDLTVLKFGKNLHLFVYRHKSTLCFNPHFFQSHIGSIRDTSRSNHGSIDLDRFHVFLCFGINHFDSHWLDSWDSRSNFSSKDSCAVVNRTFSNEQSFGLLGNFAIKRRHEVIESFNKGNFTSKCRVDIREL
mmetsp:Transcript_18178/g.32929  ORF Transcript_18178/g.32929 Transcript_18178/m.32929 type:complete len:248 (-) Transcript_18178:765-1508(-)